MENNVTAGSSYFLSEIELSAYYEKYFKPNENEEKVHWDIFVLINRKGYWDYKIFFPKGIDNKSGFQKIMSDRYLEKCPLEELKRIFKGKTVIVYDDSLTNGSNLFYYFLVCKSAGAKEVIPVVYALNIEFPSKKSRRLMKRESGRIKDEEFWQSNKVDDLIDEFVRNLQCKILLNDRDIDRMSNWQTQLFQKNVSPLVMDLPIINHIRGVNDNKILMSVEQFQKLCHFDNDIWKFVENEMTGWGEPVKASYFRYRDKVLDQVFPYLLHDAVVKCKYEKEGNFIKVVFTPFAVVKSISFKNVYDCFQLLYNGSIYAEKLLKDFSDDRSAYEKMENDGNLCKALFRAVIYRLSDYIGRKFQQFVKEVLELDLEYDWEIMKDNFDDDFISTQTQWYLLFDENEFRKILLQYHNDESVYPIAAKIDENVVRVKASQERVNNYIRLRVIEKKKETETSLTERIYTLETIEFELENHFYFENKEDKREMITNTCLLFLETNSFSNYILVSSEEHILFRGFRYGENSEILLHDRLWFFYAFLYAYYDNTVEKIKSGYFTFMKWLEDFLQKRGYMGVWITEDGFRFLRDFFGAMTEEDLVREIRRRSYLLDCYEYGEENSIRAKFIREAAHITKQWGKA